mmetsp:Transcript_41933/g.87644  ORF Transcript_41933/g.87644 Transcript_41933/m.87644 type:complete len:90 (+) Transcript_41933:346-615(+)
MICSVLPFLEAEVELCRDCHQFRLPRFKLDYSLLQSSIMSDELCKIFFFCGLELCGLYLSERFLQCADRLGVSLALSSVSTDQVLEVIL